MKKTSLSKLYLHEKQNQIWIDDHRFKLICSGRRFGKSRYAASESLAKAFNYEGDYDPITPPAVLLGAPTLKMVRRIFFRPLSALVKNHPLVENINRSEMIIELKGDKPNIHFVGMDGVNSDRLRGFRIYHVNADEGQDIPANTYNDVLLPALIDTPNSTMTVTGTPKGEQNILGQLKSRCELEADKWRFFNFTTYDNSLIPKDEIDNFKKLLPPEIFDQEILAKFVTPPGQIYRHFDEKRNVYHDTGRKFEKVFIGHDFGDVNPAWAVIGFNHTEKCFYVIDVIDNRLQVSEELIHSWGNISNTAMEEIEQMDTFIELCSRYHVNQIFTGHDRPSRLLTIRKTGKDKKIEGMRKAIVGKPVPQTYTLINSLYYNKMLKISQKCIKKGLDKEILSYHRKSQDGEIIDEVENKSKYHRLDAIAYCVGTLAIRYNLIFGDLKTSDKMDKDDINSLVLH